VGGCAEIAAQRRIPLESSARSPWSKRIRAAQSRPSGEGESNQKVKHPPPQSSNRGREGRGKGLSHLRRGRSGAARRPWRRRSGRSGRWWRGASGLESSCSSRRGFKHQIRGKRGGEGSKKKKKKKVFPPFLLDATRGEEGEGEGGKKRKETTSAPANQ